MLETVVSSLLAASLKGSLLILLVAAIHVAGRNAIPARWRYAMWLLVAVRLLVPFGPQSNLSVFNLLVEKAPVIERFDLAPRDVEATVVQATPSQVARASAPKIGVASLFVIAWIAGLVLLAARLAISSFRLHRRIEGDDAEAIAAALVTRNELRALFDECRRVAGVSRHVRLIETDLVKTPALHGMVRPALLLPIAMRESFTAAELRNVFLHELAHLRRLDVVTNWIVATIQVIHWFNPLVWFAVARMREERELACDELALSWLEQEERLTYGRTILKLLDRFRPSAPVPAIVGIVHHKNQVKRRLMMITSFRNPSRYALLFFALLLGLAVVSLTDANAGDRHPMMKKMKLSPAASATMARLDATVALDLQNASLAELFNAISNQTGVAIAFAPELVNDPVQQARINLKSSAVPAHLVMMETLTSVGLMCEPGENGLVVKKSDDMHKMCLEHHGTKVGDMHKECREHTTVGATHQECHHEVVVETNGTTTEAAKTKAALEGHAAHGVNEKVMVRKIVETEEGNEDGVAGKIHRKLTIKTDDPNDNDGTLEFEITLDK